MQERHGEAAWPWASLDKHTRCAHGEPIKCEHCEYITPSRQNFASHMVRHKEPGFKCSVCGKLFKKRDSVYAHELEHEGKTTCNCPTCGKGFTTGKALGQHRRLVHKEFKRPRLKAVQGETTGE